jgi:hypothetical protein
MAGLRKATPAAAPTHLPCSRCQATGCRWDQIAGKSMCPDCQESLAQGSGEPLIERTEKKPCAICGRVGALRLVTYPLNQRAAVEIDLCADHFRSLLGRKLNARAYLSLRGQLDKLGLRTEQIFLLHEAFYDEHGKALQPAKELDYCS